MATLPTTPIPSVRVLWRPEQYNRVTNGTFETNTSGWVATAGINAAGTSITRITTDGKISDAATKLRTPVGVTFGPDGAMYVVEFTGRVLRAAPVGEEQRDILAEGLRAPTAITFGPDGNLYVSTHGQGSAQGEGEIIRLRLAPPDPNLEKARMANAAAWFGGLAVFFLMLGTGYVSNWRARRQAARKAAEQQTPATRP